MSVSQVKKRFSEFESFLKKDKEGLRRLKLLKDDVNVLRTSLATAEEAEQLAIVIKDAARERADKAEAEAKELRLDVHSLKQQVASLMNAVATATKPDEEKVDNDDSVRPIEVGEYADARRTIKALRKVMPHCPKQTGDRKHHLREKSVVIPFLRQDIAEGWSHKAMWKLGAAVAIIAAENGQVTIVDPVGIDGLGQDDHCLDGFGFNFLTWFEKNHGSIMAREQPRNSFSGSWKQKPEDAQRTAEFLYGSDD